ncbi:NAD-P-binding protein [Lineolata rhizophorae]|uniref:NAD-P-binding protein n=1 Tax=Lineolata rhizophorae TaxID=578093 RepID=A0A6A6PE87_9PEZI|nr:NAD-P-binding protein [Lineolata rhizophorae]
MVTVAVAGGSGGLGLIIAHSILDSKKHKVVVLSRKENPELSALGVDVRPVDYNDLSSLIAALNGVHTVISTIAVPNKALADSQIALINAAVAAGVKRFAPSEFTISSYDSIELYAPKTAVWDAVVASGLEYTRFTCGLFHNFWAAGTPKGEKEALAGMPAWNFIINVKAGTADIPGDGGVKIAVIDTRDVARFVTASLDLPKWDEELGMLGEYASWNELVDKAEKATGRKFLRRYTTRQELVKLAEDPEKRFYNQFRIAMVDQKFTVPPTLNEKFPEIRPMSTQDFLDNAWAGVELPPPAWK